MGSIQPDIDARHNPLHQMAMGRLTGLAPWLLLLGGLLTLAGYVGPWIDHHAAALVVTGLDLGEYVKFLPAVRQAQVTVWREGFYLPPVAVSLTFTLHCYRVDLRYPWPIRAGMLGVAAVAALNLLPPAWTPTLLPTPEFRLQTTAIGLCLFAIALSPFLALAPRFVVLALCTLVILLALFFPLRDFLRVLPDVAGLYRHPLYPGWGMYASTVGLLFLQGATLAANLPLSTARGQNYPHPDRQDPPKVA
jgi:hypothetical protein